VEWVLRSPDLNSLSFSFWDYAESQVYSVEIKNVIHIQHLMKEVCKSINADMLRIIQRTTVHLKTCLKIADGHTGGVGGCIVKDKILSVCYLPFSKISLLSAVKWKNRDTPKLCFK
jgi:hypothetical protein